MMSTARVRVLVVAAWVLVSPRALLAQQQVVELGLRFWGPTPDLVLSLDGLAALGIRTVDFVQEFQLEDDSFRQFYATIGRRHKARVSKVTFSYIKDATIQRTVVSGGRSQPISVLATADIKWDLWTFGYEWDVVSTPGGFFGLITDLKYNSLAASISSPQVTGSATTDVTVPVPTVGVIGRGYLGSAASITAEWTGLKLDRDEFLGKFYDFDIYGTVYLGRYFGAQGGYRSVDVEYLVDDDTGTLKMKGPYFGGVLRF